MNISNMTGESRVFIETGGRRTTTDPINAKSNDKIVLLTKTCM